MLQLEISQLNAQTNQPLTLPTTPLATTPSTAPTLFPLTPVSRPAFSDFNSPATLGQASGGSSSMLYKTGGSSPGGKENMGDYSQVTSFGSGNDFFFWVNISDFPCLSTRKVSPSTLSAFFALLSHVPPQLQAHFPVFPDLDQFLRPPTPEHSLDLHSHFQSQR